MTDALQLSVAAQSQHTSQSPCRARIALPGQIRYSSKAPLDEGELGALAEGFRNVLLKLDGSVPGRQTRKAGARALPHWHKFPGQDSCASPHHLDRMLTVPRFCEILRIDI